MKFLVEDCGLVREAQGEEIFQAAAELAQKRFLREGEMYGPGDCKDYLRHRLQGRDSECFGMVMLDAQNRVIRAQEVFQGTVTQTSVYPRELARMVLEANAAAVVLFHNHPSGNLSPSDSDLRLTEKIQTLFKMINVMVLDHMIVGQGVMSFAERGLL